MARKTRIDTLDKLLQTRGTQEVGEDRWSSYAYGYLLGMMDSLEHGRITYDELMKDSIKHLKELNLAKAIGEPV